MLPLQKTSNGSSLEPFWVAVEESEGDDKDDDKDENRAVSCVTVDGEQKRFDLVQSDYESGSPAFAACMKVVESTKRLKHASVFMEPVDPDALGIPGYHEVIKRPMDISTLEENLQKGLYGKIPANQTIGRTAVSRMLHGPFRDDAVRIFDNAIALRATELGPISG